MTLLVINLSKLHLYLALVFLIFSASFIICDAEYDDFVTSKCIDDEEYTLKASFMSNLNRLLSSLPEKAGQSFNNGYYTTNSKNSASTDSETIYILLLCQGDATPDYCKGCVSAAADKIQSECPKAKTAVIWYDKCMVHYSNKSFVGEVDENIKVVYKSVDYIPDNDVNEFMKLAGYTLSELASNISKSEGPGVGDRKYYSTKGGVDFNSVMKLYNSAQCTPDLAPMDCQRCLNLMLAEMAKFCNRSRGCQVLNPSCNIRYELYPFYDDTPSPPPVTSLSPLPLPIKEKKQTSGSIIVNITLGILVLILVVLVTVLICLQCKKRRENSDAERSHAQYFNNASKDSFMTEEFLRYDFGTLKFATNNFSDVNKLGEGGFGIVYKGTYQTDEK